MAVAPVLAADLYLKATGASEPLDVTEPTLVGRLLFNGTSYQIRKSDGTLLTLGAGLDVSGTPTSGDLLSWSGSAWATGKSLTGTYSVTGQLGVDNLRLDANALAATNAGGGVTIASNGAGIVRVTPGTLTLGDGAATEGILSVLNSGGGVEHSFDGDGDVVLCANGAPNKLWVKSSGNQMGGGAATALNGVLTLYPASVATPSGTGSGISLGVASGYNYIQGYDSRPLALNPLANPVTVNTGTQLASAGITILRSSAAALALGYTTGTYTNIAYVEGSTTRCLLNFDDTRNAWEVFTGGTGGGNLRMTITDAGNIGLRMNATTAPAYGVEIGTGDLRLVGSNKIRLGGTIGATDDDVTLYRSAANTLKTDDVLDAALGLAVNGVLGIDHYTEVSADGGTWALTFTKGLLTGAGEI